MCVCMCMCVCVGRLCYETIYIYIYIFSSSVPIDTAEWTYYLDANETNGEKARRQLHKNAVSNIEQSWRQQPTKKQLYSLVPQITKTIQVRRTGYLGHCWRSRVELISDVLQWTPSYGRAKTGQPARTYIQQLSVDTGCSIGDILEAMDDKEGGGRGSWRSLLIAWHDDDDDVCITGHTV